MGDTGVLDGVTVEVTSGPERLPYRRVSVEVMATVTEATGVSVEAILGRSRTAPVVWARHLAMWLIRERFEFSYPQIGRVFGRDHTTVIHGIRTVEAARNVNPDLADWLDSV